MDNPVIPAPKVISLGSGSGPAAPKAGRSWFKWLFVFGGLVVLVGGLAVGLILVRQQQDVRSRAEAFCSNARWWADPNSACGKATQKPSEGATSVSLTPDFHWDYGGYRTGETGCVEPSGCSSYGVAVYLAEGNYSDSSIIATCNLPTSSSPIKDAPFSCFNHAPLKPNTSYSWAVTPYYGGIVHAENTWKAHFTTGTNDTATCQNVTTDKDLSALKLNDVVTFTGRGSTSVAADKIDKINFIISGAQSISTESATVLDTGTTWKATYALTINPLGTYNVRIRTHWLKADGTDGGWQE
ncbi:hypothetical protein HY440_01025 [Candidatus Microgenomates bacterium]|nr:hypothetical protein [Candidatus Microgenomates bacterium]